MDESIIIRRFSSDDAEAVSELIISTLRTINIKDYPPEYVEREAQKYTPSLLLERERQIHLYLACENGSVVGCGAISPYMDKVDESALSHIFVSSLHQGKGIGRKIIEAIERDEYFLRARRVEVPATITGCDFYFRLGFSYKNGVTSLNENGRYLLEKFR